MNILKTCALCALLTVIFLGASAQGTIPLNEPDYNKPKLFADLPDKIQVNLDALTPLFNLGMNASVTVNLTEGFPYTGTVVSATKSSSVQSVVIRSANRQGSALTFTRVILEDGSYKYLGRIISLRHSDVFELVKEEESYYFKKKQLYDMINE